MKPLKRKYKSVKICKKASENDSFHTASLNSVAPVKVLLSQVFQRLELKGKSIKMGTAVSQADIDVAPCNFA